MPTRVLWYEDDGLSSHYIISTKEYRGWGGFKLSLAYNGVFFINCICLSETRKNVLNTTNRLDVHRLTDFVSICIDNSKHIFTNTRQSYVMKLTGWPKKRWYEWSNKYSHSLIPTLSLNHRFSKKKIMHMKIGNTSKFKVQASGFGHGHVMSASYFELWSYVTALSSNQVEI